MWRSTGPVAQASKEQCATVRLRLRRLFPWCLSSYVRGEVKGNAFGRTTLIAREGGGVTIIRTLYYPYDTKTCPVATTSIPAQLNIVGAPNSLVPNLTCGNEESKKSDALLYLQQQQQ